MFISIVILFSLQSNAFLNDSFIESPQNQTKKDNENNQNIINKKSDSIFGTSNLAIISEKGESSAERTNSAKRDSTSRQLNFDEVTGDKVNKKEHDRPKIALFSKIQSNENAKKLSEVTSTRTSDASWKAIAAETKSVDNLVAPIKALAVTRTTSAPTKTSDSMLNEQKLCTELQTPKIKNSISDSTNVVQKPNTDDETPYKTFQVPQTSTMRRVQSSSQQRTILSSANQPKKCRNDLEKEFRSQKVLFTTPSAVSRPAMKAMNNLDLDDSLNCYKSSPMVSVNLSPVNEERNKENNQYTSIESMDDLYRSIDKIDGKIDASKKDDVKVNTSTTANQNEIKQEKKDKVIQINGKDFVVLNKLGQGGSSTVFLVEHKDTKLQCALKVNFPFEITTNTFKCNEFYW